VSNTTGYIALVHKDKDTSYGVSFPDVPGCISAGDTFTQAVDNASEALAGHLAIMEADGDELPMARTIEELKKDKDFVDDSADAVIAFVAPRSDQITKLQFDVTSPNATIREVAYELSKRELLITFSTGRRYVYDNVPLEVVESLKRATSRGAFFNEQVHARYPHREFSERFLVAVDG
jgi:predicted RNase H-like HicB family nuclease